MSIGSSAGRWTETPAGSCSFVAGWEAAQPARNAVAIRASATARNLSTVGPKTIPFRCGPHPAPLYSLPGRLSRGPPGPVLEAAPAHRLRETYRVVHAAHGT